MRQRIRIIRKKKKTPKEKIQEFLKQPINKAIVALSSVIVIMLLLIWIYSGKESKKIDLIGDPKRIEYLSDRKNEIDNKQINELLSEFKDGFGLFGIYENKILFQENLGTQKQYKIDWANTQFISTDNRIEIVLPPIYDSINDLKIASSKIIARKNNEFAYNAVEGTNMIQKAEIKSFGDYGKIIIIGLQNR
ncbi:MAG: hypothetical protein KDC88_13090 [Ignavibacteriae bacterium]|nr:hypothetical protein [Ignavibacteriota bacterium]MCB9260067.1 hypothetical protein [Ignavibacteriales bacterium]